MFELNNYFFLSKLSKQNPTKRYSYVGELQQIINSIFQGNINTTAFELIFGIKMKFKIDIITELVNAERQTDLSSLIILTHAKRLKQVLKVQSENRKTLRNPESERISQIPTSLCYHQLYLI